MGLYGRSHYLDIVPLGKSFAQAHCLLWHITDDRKTFGQFFKVPLEA